MCNQSQQHQCTLSSSLLCCGIDDTKERIDDTVALRKENGLVLASQKIAAQNARVLRAYQPYVETGMVLRRRNSGRSDVGTLIIYSHVYCIMTLQLF